MVENYLWEGKVDVEAGDISEDGEKWMLCFNWCQCCVAGFQQHIWPSWHPHTPHQATPSLSTTTNTQPWTSLGSLLPTAISKPIQTELPKFQVQWSLWVCGGRQTRWCSCSGDGWDRSGSITSPTDWDWREESPPQVRTGTECWRMSRFHWRVSWMFRVCEWFYGNVSLLTCPVEQWVLAKSLYHLHYVYWESGTIPNVTNLIQDNM